MRTLIHFTIGSIKIESLQLAFGKQFTSPKQTEQQFRSPKLAI